MLINAARRAATDLGNSYFFPKLTYMVRLNIQASVLKMGISLSRLPVCPWEEMLMASLGSHKYMTIVDVRFSRMVSLSTCNILYCQTTWQVSLQKTLSLWRLLLSQIQLWVPLTLGGFDYLRKCLGFDLRAAFFYISRLSWVQT